MKEPRETVEKWSNKHGFTFPVLLDDGKMAAAHALPDVLPDLPREDTVIASNLLIDGQRPHSLVLAARHGVLRCKAHRAHQATG